jgi:hypothetical protein
MAQQVWKYPLALNRQQMLALPAGSQILSIQYQGDELVLWALVDAGGGNRMERRNISIFGTGSLIEDHSMVHLATVQMPGAQLAWHIFEGDPG